MPIRYLSARALVLFLTLQPARAIADAPQLSDTAAQQLAQQVLDTLVEQNGVPGMGAAVWQDGSLRWEGSSGLRDVARSLPVNRNTRFRLASVSKVITATALAQLAQDRHLDLDLPLGTWLKDLRDDWAAITPRMLAAHISGLPHYQEIDAQRGGAHFASVGAALDLFRDRALLHPPGSQYSYSSWGYTLLSAVIEAAAEQPFLEYLGAHVVDGLDIAADATGASDPTTTRVYEFDASHRAVLAPAHDFSYTWAGGGLAATPGALARFGARVLTHERLSAEQFAAMTAPARLNDGTPVKDSDYTVGVGWRSGIDVDGATVVHHAGVTIGARSALVLWPQEPTAVSVLSNALWVSSIEQTAQMLAAPFRPRPPDLPLRTCPQQALRYSGSFGTEAITGEARFELSKGVCIGELKLAAALATYFNAFPQQQIQALKLIGLDPDGGLGRAALVSNIGVYDLRADGEDYTARLSGQRVLRIRLHAPEPD